MPWRSSRLHGSGRARESFRPLLDPLRPELAAIGTGGGWAAHKWHFTHGRRRDPGQRPRVRAKHPSKPAQPGVPAMSAPCRARSKAMSHWIRRCLAHRGPRGSRPNPRAAMVAPSSMNRSKPLRRQYVSTGSATPSSFLNTLEARNITILADMFHMRHRGSLHRRCLARCRTARRSLPFRLIVNRGPSAGAIPTSRRLPRPSATSATMAIFR